MQSWLPQTEHIQTRWHDPEEDILCITLMDGTTWAEIEFITAQINQRMMTRNHPIFTVTHVSWQQQTLPLGGRDYARLLRLLKIDMPQEVLTFFVVEESASRLLLQTFCRAYELSYTVDRFRFTHTLDEALELIADWQRQNIIEKGNDG